MIILIVNKISRRQFFLRRIILFIKEAIRINTIDKKKIKATKCGLITLKKNSAKNITYHTNNTILLKISHHITLATQKKNVNDFEIFK